MLFRSEKSNVNATYAPVVTLSVEGSGTQVVVIELTNQDNGQTAIIGRYEVNFEEKRYTPHTEKIREAFEAVGGIQQETEPPVTEPPATEPPQTWAPATEPPVDPVVPEEPQEGGDDPYGDAGFGQQ